MKFEEFISFGAGKALIHQIQNTESFPGLKNSY
jgi:hypothetical protein